MFGIGGSELIFIILIAIMLFGADKIPEIARTVGKGMSQLKNATDEIKHEITKSAEISVITDEIDKAKAGFNKMLHERIENNSEENTEPPRDNAAIEIPEKINIEDIADGPIKRLS